MQRLTVCVIFPISKEKARLDLTPNENGDLPAYSRILHQDICDMINNDLYLNKNTGMYVVNHNPIVLKPDDSMYICSTRGLNRIKIRELYKEGWCVASLARKFRCNINAIQ